MTSRQRRVGLRRLTGGLLRGTLVGSAVLAAGCGGAQSRLASHVQRGQLYYAQGNYDKAGVEFRNAMQIAPKDATARLMAGHVSEHLGRFGPALSLYQSVIDSNPDNLEARASAARLLTLAGVPQRALDTVKPGLEQHPDDVELLVARAAAKLGLKDEEGAQADIGHALKLSPTNEDAVALRAGLYRQHGDYAAAATLVEGAARQLPASTSLHEMLVSLYVSANQPAKAQEQLRTLIGLRPAEQRYRNQLAALDIQQQRPDDAQRELQDTVKAFPDSDAAKISLVNLVATQHSPAEGEQLLRDFIKREPTNYTLRLQLGTLLERSGHNKEATAAYQEIVKLAEEEPMGLTARDRIAALAVTEHRYDDALKLLKEVLQKNPRDDIALRLRGEIALERHDPMGAIPDFRAVLRDQPRAVSVQLLLARAHVENDEPALAEEVLRAARDTTPDDSSLRIALAQLLLKENRAGEAVALLEEGARGAPDGSPLHESLVRAHLAKRDFAAARDGAERLKAKHPDTATPYYLAGLAAQGAGQMDDAQKNLERALTLQPRSLETLAALARLEIARKRPEQALALVQKVIDRDPNAYNWNLLGELYITQSNVPRAQEALGHARQLSPTWWVPYRNLALASLAANNPAGALTAYQDGIKAAPTETGLVAELAQLQEKQGRADEAIASYETSLRLNPRDRLIANNLAILLVTYRKDSQSLDRARDLTRQFDTSTDGNLLDTDGWVRFKRAEYADALPALERAIQQAPNSPVIRYHLGMAELQTGRPDRARADLQAAVSGASTFEGVNEARATLASLKSGAG